MMEFIPITVDEFVSSLDWKKIFIIHAHDLAPGLEFKGNASEYKKWFAYTITRFQVLSLIRLDSNHIFHLFLRGE